jgi:hypothetical protein
MFLDSNDRKDIECYVNKMARKEGFTIQVIPGGIIKFEGGTGYVSLEFLEFLGATITMLKKEKELEART